LAQAFDFQVDRVGWPADIPFPPSRLRLGFMAKSRALFWFVVNSVAHTATALTLLEAAADTKAAVSSTTCGPAIGTCWHAVRWAMLIGIHKYPEWYPNLTKHSTEDEIQGHLFSKKRAGCAKPCATVAGRNGADEAVAFLAVSKKGAASTKPLTSKIFFVKSHSTGSSTMTSILQRYCDGHGKACFIPPPDWSASHTYHANDLKQFCEDDKVSKALDIWPNHVIFDPDAVDCLVPGSFKISIFRRPLDRVESAFRHLGPDRFEKAMSDLAADKWLEATCGAGSHGMPMSHHIPLNTFKHLDFVMLTEKYDLSLVLLRRRLGWRLSDIVYLKSKDFPNMHGEQFKSSRPKFDFNSRAFSTTAGRSFLQSCVKGDEAAIYRMAEQKFDEQLATLGRNELLEVGVELRHLQGVLDDVAACCTKHVRDAYCRRLAEDNMDWVERHRNHKRARKAHRLRSSRCTKFVRELP